VIVAQVALAGSSTLQDFVVIGGQAGVIGHATVGMGAQIAAKSAVGRDVPPGERWAGVPAKPIKQVFREMAAVERLTRTQNAAHKPDQSAVGDKKDTTAEGQG
jgi:UDP-3-O-[3-hydroxymyristoyl] glucosamine N-acyltransferase